MKLKALFGGVLVAAAIEFASPVHAADILCQDVNNNHMLVDSSYVSACLDAGVGNLTGNPANDLFITGVGGSYSYIGTAAWDQNGDSGTFSFGASLWQEYSDIAIGFKFGTGNMPDEWFVYSLQDLVSSGIWTFVNLFDKGGGLSHVNLYGIPGDTPPGGQVSEPSALALIGLSLAAAGLIRRRRRA